MFDNSILNLNMYKRIPLYECPQQNSGNSHSGRIFVPVEPTRHTRSCKQIFD